MEIETSETDGDKIENIAKDDDVVMISSDSAAETQSPSHQSPSHQSPSTTTNNSVNSQPGIIKIRIIINSLRILSI